MHSLIISQELSIRGDIFSHSKNWHSPSTPSGYENSETESSSGGLQNATRGVDNIYLNIYLDMYLDSQATHMFQPPAAAQSLSFVK